MSKIETGHFLVRKDQYKHVQKGLVVPARENASMVRWIMHTLITTIKKWRPNQPRSQQGVGGFRGGRGKRELTASRKDISRSCAIASTVSMMEVLELFSKCLLFHNAFHIFNLLLSFVQTQMVALFWILRSVCPTRIKYCFSASLRVNYSWTAIRAFQ